MSFFLFYGLSFGQSSNDSELISSNKYFIGGEVKVPNAYRHFKGISKPSRRTLNIAVLIAVYWGDDRGRTKVKYPKLEGHIESNHPFLNKKNSEVLTVTYGTSYREMRIIKNL
ncbi:hypothetical protein [Croceitalea sp. MTPC5]|uniref:hypothetical protein n=1 Tax=Croceitalea sp. MTPC5 TaxID=3056565 RepID=UPI0030D516A3